MPKTNALDIFYHDANDGFESEYAADGAASDGGHTHQRRKDTSGGSLIERKFDETAVVFGPLRPGEWEAAFLNEDALGNALGAQAIVFRISDGWNVAVATTDAILHVRRGMVSGGNANLVWARFSLTPEKRFISFVTTQAAADLRVSLRLLKQR